MKVMRMIVEKDKLIYIIWSTPGSATHEIYWKIINIDKDRCMIKNDDNEQFEAIFSRFASTSTPLEKGYCVYILDHNDYRYECYGTSGIAYHSSCFDFPLKNETSEPSWKRNFNAKLMSMYNV